MERTTCRARASRARGGWLRIVLALGLLFGIGDAAAQCALTATVGVPYSQSFTATGGSPYSWSISVGALPAGLALGATTTDTAVISGTPRAGGSFSFTLRVASASGTGTLACSMAVAAPTITITPATLPAGEWGVAYSQVVAASGSIAPYTYAVTSGVLPGGMSLSSTGMLSGTPTETGTFPVTIQARDSATGTGPYAASRGYLLVINGPAIDVQPASLAAAVASAPYAQTLSASGGTAPYTWSILSGALPAGLTLDGAGVLSGTPTATGSFNVIVRAIDANGFFGDRPYTLDVAAPVIAVVPASLPPGSAGSGYTQSLSASGGTGPYTWAVAVGALPAGMSLSSSGVLSGTPTVSGSFSLAVRATDANGFTGEQAYTLTIAAPTIAITPASLPAGSAGSAYAQPLSASGGAAPYAWTLASGALPSGMSLSTAGVLSGTPTVSGSFNLSVRATDANGFTGDQAYTLAIAAPTIAVTPVSLPPGTAGAAYTQALSAGGGVAPYAWSLASGALPSGMSLSSGGVLSGTPTVSGGFNLTVRATDANGFTGDQAYTLAIAAPVITLTPSALPAATAGAAYAQTLSAAGGVAPYTYALASGTLPAGLALSANGQLTGTPTVVGSFSLGVRATDANGFSGTQAYTLVVAALVPVAGNDSAHTTALQAVTVDVTANDSNGPFTAASIVSVAPLGAGTATIVQSGNAWLLTFVPSPTFSGTASIGYTVSNAYATSSPGMLTVQVDARPDPSRDPDVVGLLSAQANATRGFARAQVQNVQQRLESLHGGADGNGWHNGLSLASAAQCERGTPTDAGLERCAQPRVDSDGAAVAPQQQSAAPLGLWTAGVFGSGDRDPRFGRSALDFETSGLSVGADYRLSASFVLGASLGYGRDRTHVGVLATRADGEAYSAAAYATWSPADAAFLDAVFGYQHLSFDTRRTVASNGATVSGSRDGSQWFGSLTAGYEYGSAALRVAPYARVDLANATLDGYAERGDAVYALRYGRQDVETGTASVGLRMEEGFDVSWGTFSTLLRLEHQHDFQGQGDSALQYADLPAGPVYRTVGDTFDRSRWLLGLGTGFAFGDGLGLKFEYLYIGDGQAREHSLRLLLQGRF